MANDIKFKIEFPRGDSMEKAVQLTRGGEPAPDVFNDVFFTVKKNAGDYDVIFQKKMSTGGIVNDSEGHYVLYIAPEDTNELDFSEYDCDFEFVKTGYKRTFCGKLKLLKEVTHYYNEG